ncbi:MAG: succinate dehydrogenase, cytochrome b556 subunit [Mariprofundaceae bacterium]
MSEDRPIKQFSRPLSPRISIYRLHPETLASGAHRLSGVVLILFVPFYLWMLYGMTGSPEDFQDSLAMMHTSLGRIALWTAGTAFIYHFFSGIRMLCLDAGWGESRSMMRLSSQIMLGVAAVTAVILGVALW